MARKPSTTSGSDYEMPEFVRCELTDAERDECRTNLVEWDKIAETIEDLAGDGYKLTISYDNRSDCISGFLTGTEGQRTNRKLALSARAPSVQGVLTVLFFKHFKKLKGDWATNASDAKKSAWG